MVDLGKTDGVDETETDEVDLAVVAYLDDGDWELEELPDHALDDLAALDRELRDYSGPALAMITVADDFVLLAREGSRLLLSDVTAAAEWDLARTVTDRLGLEVGEDDDPEPAGDLTLLVDVGVSERELADLLNEELYPEELLAELAGALGFGEDFEDLLEELEDDLEDLDGDDE